MVALTPRDQHVWDPRPVPHETEAETKTNHYETETKKVVSRPRWSRDLNIPGKQLHLNISFAETNGFHDSVLGLWVVDNSDRLKEGRGNWAVAGISPNI